MRFQRLPPGESFVQRRALLLSCPTLVMVSVLARVPGARADAPPEFRVIVNANNSEHASERALLSDMFLKKVTRWPDGETVRAVDLRPDSAVRRRFTEAVLKRSVGAVRSYWQQRIFSGRDVPPPELESDDGVVAFVAKYPGAVGYVSGSAKLLGVRAISIR